MEPTTIIQDRKELQAPKMVRKVLLICGILSSLLFVGTDILAGTLYAGYSFTSQAVSELFAIGAPTSHLVVPLFTLSSVLLVAFALGVWLSAGRKRALRIMALMIVGNAVNSLVLWNFFPGTILILLVPATLAFSYVPQVGANQPTPWLGLTERISIYGNQLWQVVLSIVLLWEEKRPGAFR